MLVGTGLFLLLAACLDRQELVRTPLYALQAWVCCAALGSIATPALGPRAAVRLAGRALLLAAPLAVVLFVFFPRLPGSFWAIPRGGEALTGLSDSMTPGQHHQLVADYDTAFRVRFAGPRPAAAAALLARTGAARLRRPHLAARRRRSSARASGCSTWARRTATASRSSPRASASGLRSTCPRTPPPRTCSSPTTTSCSRPNRSRRPVSYEAVSYPHTRAPGRSTPAARREDTALPAGANPRTRELAQTLYARAGGDAAS